MQGTVLTIGGSDPSGAAGIQADIKTITTLGGYAAAVITAVTAQNTKGVYAIKTLEPDFIISQISYVLKDMTIDCIKIGLLYNEEIVGTVGRYLENLENCPPIVLDPVIYGKKGDGQPLLNTEAIRLMKVHLFPVASIITPNIPEAAALAGMDINGQEDLEKVATMLVTMSPAAALVKAGRLDQDSITDVLATLEDVYPYTKQKLPTAAHGAGCALSAAIATGIAQGMDIKAAVDRAETYIHNAIETAPQTEEGAGPINHSAAA